LRVGPQFYAVIEIKGEDAKSVAVPRVIHDGGNGLRHGMNIDGYSIDVKISNFIRHSVTSPKAAMQSRWVKHAPPRFVAIPPNAVAVREVRDTFANGTAARTVSAIKLRYCVATVASSSKK